MNILIASDQFPPEHWGGAASVAGMHARELARRGESVTVCTVTQDKDAAGWSEFEGIAVLRIYSQYAEKWRAWKSLINKSVLLEFENVIKEVQPDVVHFHNVHMHLSYKSIKIAKNSGAKVFITLHDVMSFHYDKLYTKSFVQPDDISVRSNFNYKVRVLDQIQHVKKRYNPFRNFIIKQYLKYADKIIAVSQALKDALTANGISNITVIHNGIDTEDWKVDSSSTQKLKNELGIDNRPVVLVTGRLTGTKGRDVLLKAMIRVVVKQAQAVLVAVGDDSDISNKTTAAFIKDNKLTDNVRFIPAVQYSEMKRYYALADVVVVPSLCFDSFPTANLEAMALHKPVIATHFGGSREVVEDGVTGFIINPLNTDDLAEKVLSLISNKQKARQFGEAGFERVSKSFNVIQNVDKLLTLYKAF